MIAQENYFNAIVVSKSYQPLLQTVYTLTIYTVIIL